jgi:hypothetical protein
MLVERYERVERREKSHEVHSLVTRDDQYRLPASVRDVGALIEYTHRYFSLNFIP